MIPLSRLPGQCSHCAVSGPGMRQVTKLGVLASSASATLHNWCRFRAFSAGIIHSLKSMLLTLLYFHHQYAPSGQPQAAASSVTLLIAVSTCGAAGVNKVEWILQANEDHLPTAERAGHRSWGRWLCGARRFPLADAANNPSSVPVPLLFQCFNRLGAAGSGHTRAGRNCSLGVECFMLGSEEVRRRHTAASW